MAPVKDRKQFRELRPHAALRVNNSKDSYQSMQYSPQEFQLSTGAAGQGAGAARPAPAPAPRTEGWQGELDLERELEMEREMAVETEGAAADEPDGPQPWPEDHTAQGPSHEAELEAAMRALPKSTTPLSPGRSGWGNGAERPRLVQTQCWCPQGRWLLSPSGVCG